MNEPIKMTGRLLLFGVVDNIGTCFPSNCDLSFPEKVPVAWRFNFNDPDTILGHAKVRKDERGLVCEVELTNFDRNILRYDLYDELYIGGYYTHIKTHEEHGVKTVDEARLIGIGVTLAPVNEEYKIVVKEEPNERIIYDSLTKIILGERCSGKTTRLIERSAKEGLYILTATKHMAGAIAHQAKCMGLDIPYPVTLDEYLRGNKFRGSIIRRDGLLIDDLDLVLQNLFSGIPIREVTLTDRGNVERLKTKMKPLDHELEPYRFHDLIDDPTHEEE